MKLKELSIFKNIADDEIEKIVSCSHAVRKKLAEGEYVFRQSEKPVYLYIILSGNVIITKDFYSGRQDLLLSLSEGDVLGEIFFAADKKEYYYDALTTCDTEVLMLPFSFFYGFCENACSHHQEITKNMLEIFSERNYEITQKAHILGSNNLRERITLWLLDNEENGEVLLNMNRENLANFLATTRPSLSRELMKMQEEGLIRVDKSKIYIIDISE